MHYAYIFNPAADKGRAAGERSRLEAAVGSLPSSSFLETRYAGHARELALEAARQGSAVVACGGDGTLHDVVNGALGQGVPVGILPVGSANDFVKSFHAGVRAGFDPQRLASAGRRRVDLGHVRFGEGPGEYFVNSLGIGFTGRIAQRVAGNQRLKGELSYLSALLRVLIGYTPLKMHIAITLPDGILQLDEPVFAFSVANGKVEGGKFRIAPDAELSDGLLDVCILKAIPHWKLPHHVLRYLRGTQARDPRVLCCKARKVEVVLEQPDVLHMDGEVHEPVGGRVTITAAPGAIAMLDPGRERNSEMH